MPGKPSYEELKQKIRRLQSEAMKQNRALESIRKSEERFRLQYKKIPVPTYTWQKQGESLVLVDFNDAAQAVSKGQAEKLRGKSTDEIYRDRPDMISDFNACLKRKEAIQRTTHYRVSATGELKYLNVTYVFVPPDGVVVHAEDVTDQKKSEMALRESEKRFRDLVGMLPEIVFEVDQELRVTYANHVAFESTGYSREDLETGLRVVKLIAREDHDKFHHNISRLRRGEHVGAHEYMIVRKDGSRFPAIIHSNVILDGQGVFAGLGGVMVNITEQKWTQEESINHQKKLRLLTSWLSLAEERERQRLAGEVHDRIGSSLALVQIKLESLAVPESCKAVSAELAEIADSVNEIVTDTQSLISEISWPTLHEVGFVEAIKSLTAKIQQQHHLTIQCQNDGREKNIGKDLAILLFRSVRELLVNIVKHSKAENARVSIAGRGEKLRIDVQDDGIGFDPSEIGRMPGKEPSFGFFSIRERLYVFGGTLDIKSKPSKGTTVTLEVPLAGLGA